MQPILQVSNLTKTYGKFTAVSSITFEVYPKEIFALIGPNGAGKSTTLKIISTILSPTAGEVTVCEANLLKDSDTVREIISYLPEEAGAYKNLSGRQYLQFMAALHSKDHQEQQRQIQFAESIVNLSNRLNDKVKTYSKGMTRKLLLARAVMSRPKLAILDEPTSGLDIINALEIRRIVKDLAKEGMSVLLSSHNMLEIEFLSDRVAIINQGKIYETGTPEELKAKHQAKNLEEVFVAVTKAKNE